MWYDNPVSFIMVITTAVATGYLVYRLIKEILDWF